MRQKQPPEVFLKKGVLKTFAKFMRKRLRQSQVSATVAAEKIILEELVEIG